MVTTNVVVVTSVVSVALVTMLVVGERHGVVHAVRVVGAAVGGEREGNGLGTETFRRFGTRNDAAPVFGLSRSSSNLHVVCFLGDLCISCKVGSAHDALYTFEVL